MRDSDQEAHREVTVPNRQGLHARPIMRFVDLASRFRAQVWVTNVSGLGERVDGKSAMQMMLLEAAFGSALKIEACGADAREAVEALAALVAAGFPPESPNGSSA